MAVRIDLHRIKVRFVVASLALAGGFGFGVQAQERPDFTGVWALDPARSETSGVYGQVRVVTQTTSEVGVAILQYAGYAKKTWNVIPWRFRIGRWGPRRGGE